MANNLHKGGDRGGWKPRQQGWKKQEKKEPRRVGNPPLSFREFIQAQPQGCFVCYGRVNSFQHDHQTCPVQSADTKAYKKAHQSTKLASAKVRETTVEEELSKMRTELAKEIKKIKRSWTPKQDKVKDKDKDKKGKGRWKKKGDVNEVAAEDGTLTTSDAP